MDGAKLILVHNGALIFTKSHLSFWQPTIKIFHDKSHFLFQKIDTKIITIFSVETKKWIDFCAYIVVEIERFESVSKKEALLQKFPIWKPFL